MDLGLRGSRALITGGSKGIGLAIASSLAAEEQPSGSSPVTVAASPLRNSSWAALACPWLPRRLT